MSEWISVEDRLPEVSDDYLTFNPKSIYPTRQVTTWYGKKWANSNGYITHWMPIPEPPNV